MPLPGRTVPASVVRTNPQTQRPYTTVERLSLHAVGGNVFNPVGGLVVAVGGAGGVAQAKRHVALADWPTDALSGAPLAGDDMLIQPGDTLVIPSLVPERYIIDDATNIYRRLIRLIVWIAPHGQ